MNGDNKKKGKQISRCHCLHCSAEHQSDGRWILRSELGMKGYEVLPLPSSCSARDDVQI
jgi:hypothetical protein